MKTSLCPEVEFSKPNFFSMEIFLKSLRLKVIENVCRALPSLRFWRTSGPGLNIVYKNNITRWTMRKIPILIYWSQFCFNAILLTSVGLILQTHLTNADRLDFIKVASSSSLWSAHFGQCLQIVSDQESERCQVVFDDNNKAGVFIIWSDYATHFGLPTNWISFGMSKCYCGPVARLVRQRLVVWR